MISQKDIQALDFSNIEQYFNYILESEINGQRQQVKSLIKDMSKAQKKECIKHLQNDIFGGSDKDIILEILYTSI